MIIKTDIRNPLLIALHNGSMGTWFTALYKFFLYDKKRSQRFFLRMEKKANGIVTIQSITIIVSSPA